MSATGFVRHSNAEVESIDQARPTHLATSVHVHPAHRNTPVVVQFLVGKADADALRALAGDMRWVPSCFIVPRFSLLHLAKSVR